MALTTYAGLKTAVINRSGRDDIAAYVDDFIALTEELMWSVLRVRWMEDKTSLTGSTRFVTLPTDYLEVRRIVPLYQSNYYKELTRKSPNALRVLDEEGIPSEYAITNTLELDRIPLGTLEFQYFKKLTGLSTSNTTNDILTNHPSLYLNGCLAEAYAHSEESEEEQKYREKFYSGIDIANERHISGQGSGGVIQVEGPTP